MHEYSTGFEPRIPLRGRIAMLFSKKRRQMQGEINDLKGKVSSLERLLVERTMMEVATRYSEYAEGIFPIAHARMELKRVIQMILNHLNLGIEYIEPSPAKYCLAGTKVEDDE